MVMSHCVGPQLGADVDDVGHVAGADVDGPGLLGHYASAQGRGRAPLLGPLPLDPLDHPQVVVRNLLAVERRDPDPAGRPSLECVVHVEVVRRLLDQRGLGRYQGRQPDEEDVGADGDRVVVRMVDRALRREGDARRRVNREQVGPLVPLGQVGYRPAAPLDLDAPEPGSRRLRQVYLLDTDLEVVHPTPLT